MTSAYAVWGDPVAHSKSPQLHLAAAGVLGLDWSFARERVTESTFDRAFVAAPGRLHGLAVTMPLKDHAARAVDRLDDAARATGAVNTVDLGPGCLGYNTDVAGLTRALAELGFSAPGRVRVLGSGATAMSAAAALGGMGAEEVFVVSRREAPAMRILDHLAQRGIAARWQEITHPEREVDLTIATLPNNAQLPAAVIDALAECGGDLFDVAYHPWPSAIAARWDPARAHSGITMLLHQAVMQVRVFALGDPSAELPREGEVVAAMRASVMED